MKKTNTSKTASPESKSNQQKFLFGILLVILAVGMALSFVSYFLHGVYDQSQLSEFTNKTVPTYNWLGKIGATLSHFFLYKSFGIASFFFVKLLFLAGLYLMAHISLLKYVKLLFWDLYMIVLVSLLFGFFYDYLPELSGVMGFELNQYLQSYLGKPGTLLVLVFGILFYLIVKVKVTVEDFKNYYHKLKLKKETEKDTQLTDFEEYDEDFKPTVEDTTESHTKFEYAHKKEILNKNKPEEEDFEFIVRTETPPSFEIDKTALKPTINNPSELQINKITNEEEDIIIQPTHFDEKEVIPTKDEHFFIEKVAEESVVEETLAQKLVRDYGEFDPRLELSQYKFPPIDMLKESTQSITINQAELEENKDRIVETLRNYKIGIAQIKATIGPSVTLYEIVPDVGIRISKIKSLEDDIALSLAALGIRIIAPIPGKGTIGIEVPNAKPTMVSMKSVIASPKFQQAEMELPIALGKTISNETFVFDLAKMPHLLMAGATGQGKSVGLNAVITSLLYKKHPAEVKFVLVDPKKVELTLYNKIERHYLAKLPDNDEAIITHNDKVINTLNSLCIEMDNRYMLLKDASVRNIKEYNEKFKLRKLNPDNGHQFLPYIVLVVDEFADLIMTAGKEVETPIARLAQLARAVGIHLIIATQRPSVNVITGLIKANFPARIAFRVTSKIDSRTILDSQGADQLIGRGDLLFTQGNDLIRVQCAFVDTPEVEKITEYIGNQKGYADAFHLPEYVGEEGGTTLDIDISERDSLFREAAEVIVTAQQGSASILQRKLKLGYNRAGRLIDQLEAAGIVGPFEGSKARSVIIPDLASLDEFLKREGS